MPKVPLERRRGAAPVRKNSALKGLGAPKGQETRLLGPPDATGQPLVPIQGSEILGRPAGALFGGIVGAGPREIPRGGPWEMNYGGILHE